MVRWYVIALALFTQLECRAALAQNQIPVPNIVVRATAERMVRPVKLVVSLGVEARATSHVDAMSEVSRTMARVLEEAVKFGIPKVDVETSRMNLLYFDNTKERFRAENIVRVTLRNPDKAGELIGQLVAAGANRVHGVHPIISKSDDLARDLRAEAIKRAKQQALETVEAGDVRLGKILTISTEINDWNRPYLIAPRSQAQAVEAPVEVGSVTISATASISFAIDQ